MKTIVEGKFKFYYGYDKIFKCPDCGWIGVANDIEYRKTNYAFGDFYFVFCPCCGQTVPELEPGMDEYDETYSLVRKIEKEED